VALRDAIDPTDGNNDAADTAQIAQYNSDIEGLQDTNQDLADDNYVLQNGIVNGTTIVQEGIVHHEANVTNYNNSVTELNARIAELNTEIADLNSRLIPDSNDTGDLNNLIALYRAEKAMLEAQLSDLGSSSNVGIMQVDQEITARSSNIYITGDSLTGSIGGQLIAPGDTLIDIHNDSMNSLRTNKMTIPDEQGGHIFFNNAKINNKNDINLRNVSGTANFGTVETSEASTPMIQVLNTRAAPYGQRAPDIFVDGDIRNTGGEVSINSRYGSVQIKSGVDVLADIIRIRAGRNVFIGYDDGFRNIAGEINGLNGHWTDITDSAYNGGQDINGSNTPWTWNDPEQIIDTSFASDPSVIAGNMVFIAGEYLNINGIVQSGVQDKSVTITPAAIANAVSFLNSWTPGTSSLHEIPLSTYKLSGTEDLANMALFFDAENQCFELGAGEIMGGYMELFGTIMNTAVGELRVMDGYGRISVTNPSSYPVRLTSMNTGSGIEGTVKITDLAKRTVNNEPLTTVIKRINSNIYEFNNNNAAGLLDLDNPVNTVTNGVHTEYKPREHQYYSWTVRDEFSWDEWIKRTRERWFGFTSSTEYTWGGISSQNQAGPFQVGADTLRVVSNHSETFWYDRTAYPVEYDNPNWNWSSGWHNDVWALLYIKDHAWYTRHATETILHNFNIAAFNPIDINFMGYPTGQIDVTSNAGIIVNGPIKNTSGSINMTTNGAITQGPDEFAGITAQYLNLNAGNGIGTGNAPLNVDLVTGSWLDASTGSGDINIHAGNSNLTFDLVSAPGNILLSADMDITGRNSSSLVSGLMVNLNSDHGNIGSSNAHVRVNSADSKNGGLKATSAGDMFITETTGDLYLINAESLGGNVEIKVENGGIVDNNTYETVDERAKADLFGLWDDMQLMGEKADESAEKTVSAYERMKERDYDTYWKYRRRQADKGAAYNPDYEVELTEQERVRYRNLTYLENENG